MVKKGIFFSLFSLIFVIQLLFFSRVVVDNRLFFSESIYDLELTDTVIEQLESISARGIQINAISYDKENIKFDFKNLPKYPYLESDDFTLSFIDDLNAMGENKIYRSKQSEILNISNKIFVSFQDMPKTLIKINEIDKIAIELHVNKNIIDSTSYLEFGLTPNGAEIEIYFIDENGDVIESTNGFIDPTSSSFFSVSFIDDSYANLSIDYDGSDTTLSYYGSDLEIIPKNVSFSFSNKNNYFSISELDEKLRNLWCETNSDCFFDQTCIYKKCFDNTVAYWNFYNHNQTHILDLTPNLIEGSVVSSIDIGKGVSFYAGDFSGGNIITSLKTGNYFQQNDEFSVSLWFNTRQKYYNDTGGRTALIDNQQYFTIADSGGFALKLATTSLRAKVSTDTGGQVVEYNLENLGDYVGKWHHVFFIFNENQTLQLYINNNLVESRVSSTWEPSLRDTRIGVSTQGGWTTGRFNGSIDEVIIFNKALNEEERNHIFNNHFLSLTPSNKCRSDKDCNFQETCINYLCE